MIQPERDYVELIELLAELAGGRNVPRPQDASANRGPPTPAEAAEPEHIPVVCSFCKFIDIVPGLGRPACSACKRSGRAN
jgi:hypothetical protein